jgi:hypothetical protein
MLGYLFDRTKTYDMGLTVVAVIATATVLIFARLCMAQRAAPEWMRP